VTAPPQWRGELVAPQPIELQWWRAFGDPTLDALVERALSNNTSIEVAVARVEEARAFARYARAQEAPLSAIGVSGGKSQIDFLGRPLVGWTAVPQVAISYDLDLFHRLSQATASARAALLAAAATRDAVALAIASTTASSYITLLSLDAGLATTRATLASRAGALAYAKRRSESGYTSRLELYQAQSEYEAAAQLIPAAELAISQQENALSILVGDAPHTIDRSGTLEALGKPAIPDGLPASLLRRRPDIVAAEETLVSSDHSLDSARAAMLPDLSLTGTGGASFSNLNVTNPVQLFSLGASVLSPLLDFGRLKAQSDAAAARRDQAAFTYRATALTAFREVEDGLASVQRLQEKQVSVQAQIAALRESLRIATNRYRGGYSPYLDQIDAERSLLSAQLTSIQLTGDVLNSYVTLYRAMGGGWSEEALGRSASLVTQPP
jgi:NodT family efflux transporter outer membrane factor (OMF) lipoprotein